MWIAQAVRPGLKINKKLRSEGPAQSDMIFEIIGKIMLYSSLSYLKATLLIFFVQVSFFYPLEAKAPLSPSNLSLEEKVGQLMIVHFHGEEANQEAEQLICKAHVGGIIYYNWANGLESPCQIAQLSKGLQDIAQKTKSKIPLFLAVDQEGGVVNRLRNGFTIFPGNYALGRTKNSEWGVESARMIGEELRAVGINLNLAPVVDCYTNPMNPVIGIRAFSQDPHEVAKWGSYSLQGYAQAGIIAAIKHFPGHGDVDVDSHESLPMISKSREELKRVELIPFLQLASQADVVMTAHLFVPAWDKNQCATFSSTIVQDLLRDSLNYQGVIMTDSLAMQGVLGCCSSIEEAALRSLQAGHDLLLLGGKQLLDSQNGLEFTVADVIRVHRYLVQAVKEGRLSEQRLNASVKRVLALKQSKGLCDAASLDFTLVNEQVNTLEHKKLAQEIARSALYLVKGKHLLPLRLSSKRLLIIAPDCLQEAIDQTDWVSGEVDCVYYKGLNPDQQAIQKMVQAAAQADCSLFFSYQLWRNPSQQQLFHAIAKVSSQTIGLAVRDPIDVDHLSEAEIVLCTFSPVACSLQAAFEYLIGGL